MSVEDDVRSLSARVAKLTTAVERSCTAQVESAEWCSQTQSDVATLMADVRSMSRRMDALARAVSRLTDLLDGREELKTTAAYPVAAGAYDEEIARMTAEGATSGEIARYIGCSRHTVDRRRSVLGVQSGSWHQLWTDSELSRLRAAVRECRTWEEVAEGLPGRTAHACACAARKAGLRLGPTPRRWSESDDAYLSERWNDGRTTCAEIASALGRSEKAVVNRAHTLGITNRGRKHVMAKRSMDAFWARGAA